MGPALGGLHSFRVSATYWEGLVVGVRFRSNCKVLHGLGDSWAVGVQGIGVVTGLRDFLRFRASTLRPKP